jgi:hypothetical protein
MRRIGIVLALTVALVAGFVLGWFVHVVQQLYCPTEDSCTADYRDGEWRIEEGE